MKLRILKLMEKAYDSLYDLSRDSGYPKEYETALSTIEDKAKEYGYKFKVSPSDTWKLYKMTSQEWKEYKEVL